MNKKRGRPTESPKDYMLRVRLDKETQEVLKRLAESENGGYSEIVRKSIAEYAKKRFL